MSPISPSDSNLALMHLDQQQMIQKRLDMDSLRERLSGGPDKEAKLREACEGFESVFIQKMWEQMRKNVEKSGYLHSRDEHMYQGMYDAEFSKKMTKAGGIGLADMLYEQLSQRLGESSRSASTRNDPRLPIIPSGSSVSALSGAPVALGRQAAEQGGIPLHNNKIRPLYDDPATAPLKAAAAGAAQAAPLLADDAALQDDSEPQYSEFDENIDKNFEAFSQRQNSEPAAAYGGELDFEDISHAMLADEMAGGNGEEQGGEAASTVPQNTLSPEEEALISAALRQNMAEAGRITSAQAPVAEPGMRRFGTPFATDMANPADSAAGSDTNKLSRS